MHIVMIGSGYVGLVSGACFAEMGHTVTCLDTDTKKVALLSEGSCPIYEPGLEEMLRRNIKEGRLFFTSEYSTCIPDADACFFALPTPTGEDGSCDVTYVKEAAKTLAPHLKDFTLLVVKSTVPVGTCKAVRDIVRSIAPNTHFEVVSNPEFLKEGSAVQDCLKPSRIVIGSDSERAKEWMGKIYTPFTLNHNRIIFMDIASAEMTKYAANAMLATRISFMNELSHLCESVGADITKVRLGIGSDERIGYSFLYPGPGFGGSCFPKDLRALLATARDKNIPLSVIQATLDANERQKSVLFTKAKAHFSSKGGLSGKKCAIWGISFKPDTDDIRESGSLTLIEQLCKAGATVVAYDPASMQNAKGALSSLPGVSFASSQYEACEGADALFLVTEWKQFRFPDFTLLKKLLKNPVIFDGRNQYDPEELFSLGFTHYGIGRKPHPGMLLSELLSHNEVTV